jgi:hypothetical protein
MVGGIMKTIYIAKLTEDDAQVLEAVPLNEEHNRKRMVKILKTGFIYYEKTVNIGTTRAEAIQILQNRNNNLTRRIKELWSENES